MSHTITVSASEIHLLNSEPVICMESSARFSDKYIDFILENGALTEDQSNESGGREAYGNNPDHPLRYC